MNNRRIPLPTARAARPSLADVRAATLQAATLAGLDATYAPDEPPNASDIVGLTGFAALTGAALGEGVGALVDDGEGEATDALRVLGMVAGAAFGLAMVDGGWRLRSR